MASNCRPLSSAACPTKATSSPAREGSRIIVGAVSLPLSMSQLCCSEGCNGKYVKKILLFSNIVLFMHTTL